MSCCQVIRNFVSNAIKFTPSHGTVTVNVKVVSAWSAQGATCGDSDADNGDARAATPATVTSKSGQQYQLQAERFLRVEFIDTGVGISEVGRRCCT